MSSMRVSGLGKARTHYQERRRESTTSPMARRRSRPNLEALESRQLLAIVAVTTTSDSGAGSLRAAITQANSDSSPDDIVFDIPASTAQNLNVPVSGFDPSTQTWTITLQSPLPPITNTVSIDGYTEAPVGVPYRYPEEMTSGPNGTPGDPTLIVAVPNSTAAKQEMTPSSA